MRALILFIASFAIFFNTYSYSQTGSGTSLTWMKGDNTINQAGVYGTRNVADIQNKPGARDYSATWTDANGYLWMFGGYGYDVSVQGYLNDLWRFDPNTNQWTWKRGDNTINKYGIYGTKGVAAPNNQPGSLYASMSWTDKNGNLWLFGGFGYSSADFGFLNDLWKFDPLTGNWTWVNGSNAAGVKAVYGTKGVAAPTNRPGSRYGGLTWIDQDGNLWLFGGYGNDGSSTGILNDLWKYNITTNTWTWMKGNNTIGKPGIYGTQGVTAENNQPGARYLSNVWTDKSGNFWLFGGYGYDQSKQGILNDLWKFDPRTNNWTWMKGDKISDQKAEYGKQEIPNTLNRPGARYVSVSWSDVTGDLWLFGGYGYDEVNSGYLNDLWKFDIATSTWTWMKGDTLVDQVAVYGTQGVPAHTNKSGSRNSCISWTDNSGNLWMFGGYGFDQTTSGVLNDLWRITELHILPLQLLSFDGSLSGNATHLTWRTGTEEGRVQFNVQRSFDGVEFTTVGVVDGKMGTVNDYAHTDQLIANPSRVYYRLEMILANGEINYSRIIRLGSTGSTIKLSLYPNPAKESLMLSFKSEKNSKAEIRVLDSRGATVRRSSHNVNAGNSSIMLNTQNLPSGVYYLQFASPEFTTTERFLKH